MISRCSPWLRMRGHDPERVGFLGWRCRDCSTVAATEGELLDGTGYVNPLRRMFEREDRYVTKAREA